MRRLRTPRLLSCGIFHSARRVVMTHRALLGCHCAGSIHSRLWSPRAVYVLNTLIRNVLHKIGINGELKAELFQPVII